MAISRIFWSKINSFSNLWWKRFAMFLRSFSYQIFGRRWTLHRRILQNGESFQPQIRKNVDFRPKNSRNRQSNFPSEHSQQTFHMNFSSEHSRRTFCINFPNELFQRNFSTHFSNEHTQRKIPYNFSTTFPNELFEQTLSPSY